MIDLRFVRIWFTRYWLAIWFALVTAMTLGIQPERFDLFIDARLYVLATRAWLAGGDPWMVDVRGLLFGAPPPTLLVVAPFTLFPGPSAAFVLGAVGIGAAILTVRMLRLPWWWLLFPPLVSAVVNGNVQTLLLPLLLTRAAPIAVFAKIYAAVPMVLRGRWRQVAVTIGLLVLTIPLLPWGTFIADYSIINAALSVQSNDGLKGIGLLLGIPIALVAVIIVGPERGAWLLVPAIWPSQQPYYATLVMPTASAVAAALIILPVAWSGLLALVGVAAVTLWERYRARPA